MRSTLKTTFDVIVGALVVASTNWLLTGSFGWPSNGDTSLAFWLGLVAIGRLNNLRYKNDQEK